MMAHWTAQQHFTAMSAAGVRFAPRRGDGRHIAWSEADGRAPSRDPARELATLTTYLANLPGEYLRRLESLNATLPPLAPACRLAVLLPCRNEEQHIAGMLDCLAGQYGLDGQPLARPLYEVLVLVNRLDGEPGDATAPRARAWHHPLGLAVRVVEYIHPAGEPCPLTMARKVLADLAILRAVARGPATAAFYLASEDADVLWTDPHQLAVMIDRLDRDPGLDGVRGQQDRCPWIMARHPLLMLMRRSWNFTETHMARPSLRPGVNPDFDFNWNRVVASGWNTAFTAEVYAAIGGYTRERRFEEDMDIGEKISCLRAWPGPDGQPIAQVNTFAAIPARAEGSPRRWFYRFATGIEPYLDTDGYANFFAADHERAVKFQPLEAFERLLAPVTALRSENIPVLRAMLQKDFDFLRERRGLHAAREYGRILAALGFGAKDVALDDGRIEIHSLAGPAARIARWRRQWPSQPIAADTQIGRGRRCWHGVSASGPLRVALIGCGRVVEEGHVPAYRALPTTIRVVGVCDPSARRRDLVGALLALAPSERFADVQTMLDTARPQLVVIATPSASHGAIAARCLEWGAGVLVEKPLAVDATQAQRLRELARRRALPLGTLHNYLGTALWRRGLDLLAAGSIGSPSRLHAHIAAPEALPGFGDDPAWRHHKTAAGRGCLLDQGYHLFYLSEAVFSTPIAQVSARLSQGGLAGRDVEDHAELRLNHAGGGTTDFVIDWRADRLGPTRYVVEGARGRMVLDEDAGSIEIFSPGGAISRETIDNDVNAYGDSLGESLKRIAAGGQPVTDAAQAIAVLRWIDRAYGQTPRGDRR